jgi:DNA-3-methyladenine glycosylase I
MARCFGDGDPLYEAYHDDEWGRPVRDERGLFERLSLEAFQSGLSWLTILRKRPAFRAAFAGFDPDAVARFGARDVERLLGDAGIVRNRAKIEATIANARATLALRTDGAPLPSWWPSTARRRGPRRRASPSCPRRPGDEGARLAAEGRGLSLRRPDDALRAHAGLRPRRRPPRGVPGPPGGRGRAAGRRPRLSGAQSAAAGASRPAASRRTAALSVRSHVKSWSSRPKCPYAAVFW